MEEGYLEGRIYVWYRRWLRGTLATCELLDLVAGIRHDQGVDAKAALVAHRAQPVA